MEIKKVKILILCNDKWHPASIVKKGLNYLEDKHDITWVDNTENWTSETLCNYSLVILSKSGSSWMTKKIGENFNSYVENGGSLLAIHSGTAEYDEFKEIKNILGGIFTHHPDQCIVKYKPEQGHEMTADVDSFHYTDEHYFIETHRDDLDIFLYSESEHGIQPAGWRREHGSGKVAVLTAGHNLEVWQCFNNRTLTENIINWLTTPIREF